MARTKEKKEILHKATTHEIFQCLKAMPAYSNILVQDGPNKAYIDFLKWLIEIDFYNEDEKFTIKKIATAFKADTGKVTKWINEIYHDILDLNMDKPQLFQTNGNNITLYLSSYDNHCTFYTSLPVVPREYETLLFPFIKSKIGIEYFWVNKIEHEIVRDSTTVTLWLKGGFLNKYREFALDKALFQGWIDSMDIYHKHSFEIDKELKKLFRD